MMSGVVGIFMIGFGILWTVMAATLTPIAALFGVLWTGVAVAVTVYNFKNATSKKRFSAFDITDAREEPDPLNERFGEKADADSKEHRYCPWCGKEVSTDFKFCNHCGEELP